MTKEDLISYLQAAKKELHRGTKTEILKLAIQKMDDEQFLTDEEREEAIEAMRQRMSRLNLPK